MNFCSAWILLELAMAARHHTEVSLHIFSNALITNIARVFAPRDILYVLSSFPEPSPSCLSSSHVPELEIRVMAPLQTACTDRHPPTTSMPALRPGTLGTVSPVTVCITYAYASRSIHGTEGCLDAT